MTFATHARHGSITAELVLMASANGLVIKTREARNGTRTLTTIICKMSWARTRAGKPLLIMRLFFFVNVSLGTAPLAQIYKPKARDHAGKRSPNPNTKLLVEDD